MKKNSSMLERLNCVQNSVNKTKKVKVINEKTMIAALDIGKTGHYAYFRAPNGKDIKPFPFYNFRKSFHEFWTKLCQFKRQHKLEDNVIQKASEDSLCPCS